MLWESLIQELPSGFVKENNYVEIFFIFLFGSPCIFDLMVFLASDTIIFLFYSVIISYLKGAEPNFFRPDVHETSFLF